MKKYALIFPLLSVLLFSCGTLPTIAQQSVRFSGTGVTLKNAPKVVGFISSPVKSQNLGNVVAANFFVGNRVFQGEKTVDAGQTVYQFTTTNSCRDLPQGSAIVARYEMYNTDSD